MTKAGTGHDSDDDHGNFFIKTDEPRGRINAAWAHEVQQEKQRQQREAGTAPLNRLPKPPYLDVVLFRARQYGYSVEMDDMKSILEVIDKHYLDDLFKTIDIVAEQVDIEYRNWKDPEHPMAKPSKVLLDRSRRAQAALKAAEDMEKDRLQSMPRSRKRKAAGPYQGKDATKATDTLPKASADLDTASEPLAKKPKSAGPKRAPSARKPRSSPAVKQRALTGQDAAQSPATTSRQMGQDAQPTRKPRGRACKLATSQAQTQPEKSRSSDRKKLLVAGKASGAVKTAPQIVRNGPQSASGGAKGGQSGKVKAKAKSKGKRKN